MLRLAMLVVTAVLVASAFVIIVAPLLKLQNKSAIALNAAMALALLCGMIESETTTTKM